VQNLVDVKRTKADKEAERKSWEGDSVERMDDYPYGLTVHLDHETIEKLGLSDMDLDAGEPVMLVSEATVTEDRINTVNGKTRRSMSLQLRKIAVTQEAKREDTATTLYGA
jgi:hypothetical protein